MTDSPYRTLDDNWKWYKDNYAFEYRTKDLLGGRLSLKTRHAMTSSAHR